MNRLVKMLTAACVSALVLSAVATSASASTFTYSATGELTSKATTAQTFTVGGTNVVKCQKAHGTGRIESTNFTHQDFTVTYSECSATFFGLPAGTVDISPATFDFKASGEVEVLTPITIKATGLGCKTVVGKQTLKSIGYANSSPIATITVTANVSGIVSTSPNGCPSGTTGTYTGTSIWERVGGGTISWDA